MRWLALVAALAAAPLCAQPGGILLVAKPGMIDPNFRETVLVVTHGEDNSTVGVILNRPTPARLGELAPGLKGAERFSGRVFRGGPVMQQVVVAMYAAPEAPEHAAFELLPHVYLTMHPRNIESQLARPGARLRLFSGFAGWAPQQLEAEMAEGAWYALRATEDVLFRKDTAGLWRELVEQASGARTANDPASVAALERRDILAP